MDGLDLFDESDTHKGTHIMCSDQKNPNVKLHVHHFQRTLHLMTPQLTRQELIIKPQGSPATDFGFNQRQSIA